MKLYGLVEPRLAAALAPPCCSALLEHGGAAAVRFPSEPSVAATYCQPDVVAEYHASTKHAVSPILYLA